MNERIDATAEPVAGASSPSPSGAASGREEAAAEPTGGEAQRERPIITVPV